jgi:hypothetical protein
MDGFLMSLAFFSGLAGVAAGIDFSDLGNPNHPPYVVWRFLSAGWQYFLLATILLIGAALVSRFDRYLDVARKRAEPIPPTLPTSLFAPGPSEGDLTAPSSLAIDEQFS